MKRAERGKIIEAINFFTSDNSDDWQAGMDIIYRLAYGVKWSDKFPKGKPINVLDFLRAMRDSAQKEE